MSVAIAPRAARHPMMDQPSCAWCSCFPCICNRETPCVCGGIVLVEAQTVSAGVRAHQRTPEHGAWREAHGL